MRLFKKHSSVRKGSFEYLKEELGNYIATNKHEITRTINERAKGDPLKAYEGMLEVYDEVLNRIEDKCEFKSTCKKGCADCCYQAIYVNYLEAKIILDSIDKLYRRQREKIRKVAQENMRIIEENKIPLKLLMVDDETDIQKKYLKLKLPCPLLGEEHSCIIYNDRPTVCQRYRNYGEACKCEGQISNDSYSFPELADEQALIEMAINGEKSPDTRFVLLSSLLANEI